MYIQLFYYLEGKEDNTHFTYFNDEIFVSIWKYNVLTNKASKPIVNTALFRHFGEFYTTLFRFV